ncbi:MAG TPA: class I SAM-dependent methyltransferase [Balneolaceae bacterium]|nr:class I SAM-dependent methyltransferase [Balneolaceae bacterium]
MNLENPESDPKVIAMQLRKPSGEPAKKVAELMDKVNKPLFDLTLDTMSLKENETVLELGFGSGRFFAKLFEKEENLHVSGVDYSQEMVDLAKQNNQHFIDSGQLDLQVGQSDDLPFQDATFDKVYCNMVIYFWDDPRKHLQEVQRVLKPGGQFFTGMRTKESMLQLPFTQFGFQLYSRQHWHEILTEQGFNKIEIYTQIDNQTIQQNPKILLESVCISAEKSAL